MCPAGRAVQERGPEGGTEDLQGLLDFRYQLVLLVQLLYSIAFVTQLVSLLRLLSLLQLLYLLSLLITFIALITFMTSSLLQYLFITSVRLNSFSI